MKRVINLSNKTSGVVIMIVICLFFVGVAIFLLVDTLGFAVNAKRVDGEVYYTSGIDNETAYVNFDYDGVTYRNVEVSNNSNEIFIIGENLTLYVNSKDTTDVRTARLPLSDLFGISLFLALIIFPLASVFSNLSFNVKGKRKTFMSNGKRIMAIVEQIVVDNRIEVNGKRSSYLICSYDDTIKDCYHTFKSHKVWACEGELNIQVGDYIPVYVINDDYSKYYVDIDGAYSFQNTYKYQNIK